ncbi:hypothetical protein OF83DRAFT_1082261 [Amylostereum chailletii]|nr:hypothetical protein OF83DRAFT_1082261 [Amylostereum chailletii]
MSTAFVYCTSCDQYFPDASARATHVQLSPKHPACATCSRRFLTKNSLRNHLASSPRHNFCVVCELDFPTSSGLDHHIETASVHRDDSDDDSECGSDCDCGTAYDPEDDFATSPLQKTHISATYITPDHSASDFEGETDVEGDEEDEEHDEAAEYDSDDEDDSDDEEDIFLDESNRPPLVTYTEIIPAPHGCPPLVVTHGYIDI